MAPFLLANFLATLHFVFYLQGELCPQYNQVRYKMQCSQKVGQNKWSHNLYLNWLGQPQLLFTLVVLLVYMAASHLLFVFWSARAAPTSKYLTAYQLLFLLFLILSHDHNIILSYYHIIISSQHQMVEVIFGSKSRFSTHIESFTLSSRKSPQK